jgi:transposase-like protein
MARRNFQPELKVRVVTLFTLHGFTMRHASKTLGITASVLDRWALMVAADTALNTLFRSMAPLSGSERDAELSELKTLVSQASNSSRSIPDHPALANTRKAPGAQSSESLVDRSNVNIAEVASVSKFTGTEDLISIHADAPDLALIGGNESNRAITRLGSSKNTVQMTFVMALTLGCMAVFTMHWQRWRRPRTKS